MLGTHIPGCICFANPAPNVSERNEVLVIVIAPPGRPRDTSFQKLNGKRDVVPAALSSGSGLPSSVETPQVPFAQSLLSVSPSRYVPTSIHAY